MKYTLNVLLMFHLGTNFKGSTCLKGQNIQLKGIHCIVSATDIRGKIIVDDPALKQVAGHK